MAPKSFELFEKERRVVEDAKHFYEHGTFVNAKARATFASLIKSYEKLLKSSNRLVRMSDRNEEQLNALAKNLDDQNKMLEGLSSKLSRYLSPQVYSSIFSGEQDAELSTKRKKLTVFFSDIKNFTTITEDLQPEDLTEVLNRYFQEMSWIALEHGATIDKFIGDAMLIFFGDPDSFGVEEDAIACVGMAVAMQQRMRELEPVWAAHGVEQAFNMRIGINTGYCNVGNFGSEQRMDYTIIGGEVNLTARLESQADPGGILLSFETKALIGDLYEVEERGEVSCKGIRRPVKAYALKNFHDDAEPDPLSRQTNLNGLSLNLSPARMSEDDKKLAAKELRLALKSLSPAPKPKTKAQMKSQAKPKAKS